MWDSAKTFFKGLSLFLAALLFISFFIIMVFDTGGTFHFNESYLILVLVKIIGIFAFFTLGVVFGFKEDDGK